MRNCRIGYFIKAMRLIIILLPAISLGACSKISQNIVAEVQCDNFKLQFVEQVTELTYRPNAVTSFKQILRYSDGRRTIEIIRPEKQNPVFTEILYSPKDRFTQFDNYNHYEQDAVSRAHKSYYSKDSVDRKTVLGISRSRYVWDIHLDPEQFEVSTCKQIAACIEINLTTINQSLDTKREPVAFNDTNHRSRRYQITSIIYKKPDLGPCDDFESGCRFKCNEPETWLVLLPMNSVWLKDPGTWAHVGEITDDQKNVYLRPPNGPIVSEQVKKSSKNWLAYYGLCENIAGNKLTYYYQPIKWR